jgi:hypothetical protein
MHTCAGIDMDWGIAVYSLQKYLFVIDEWWYCCWFWVFWHQRYNNVAMIGVQLCVLAHFCIVLLHYLTQSNRPD